MPAKLVSLPKKDKILKDRRFASIPAVKRLMRKGAVRRASRSAYSEVQMLACKLIEDVVSKIIVFTEYGKRNTIKFTDLAEGIKVYHENRTKSMF